MIAPFLALLLMQRTFEAAPDHYKLELDNEYVRIVRVTFGPHEKAPLHDHPSAPCIYVYLTAAGAMLFNHTDEKGPIERLPVKASQIRFNRGYPEKHTVENLGDTPSEYLRLELKTQPVELPGARDVRLNPVQEFENAMIRIARSAITTHPEYPAVVIKGTAWQWIPPGSVIAAEGATVTRIELKTAPRN